MEPQIFFIFWLRNAALDSRLTARQSQLRNAGNCWAVRLDEWNLCLVDAVRYYYRTILTSAKQVTRAPRRQYCCAALEVALVVEKPELPEDTRGVVADV